MKSKNVALCQDGFTIGFTATSHWLDEATTGLQSRIKQ